MEKLLQELTDTVRFIPEKERQSKWYRDYLDKMFTELKIANK